MLGAFPTIKPPGPKNKARQTFLQEPLDTFLPPPRDDLSAKKKTKKQAGIDGEVDDEEPPYISPLDPIWSKQPDRQAAIKRPSSDAPVQGANGDDVVGPLRAPTKSKRNRKLPQGPPKNYIGAGRPVTPTPPRQAPHAYSELRRATTCGLGDAASCALPYALLFQDVGGGVPAAEVDLTGWMVHDYDLPALAQCSWYREHKNDIIYIYSWSYLPRKTFELFIDF